MPARRFRSFWGEGQDTWPQAPRSKASFEIGRPPSFSTAWKTNVLRCPDSLLLKWARHPHHYAKAGSAQISHTLSPEPRNPTLPLGANSLCALCFVKRWHALQKRTVSLTATRRLVWGSVPLKQKRRRKNKWGVAANCLLSASEAEWKFNQLQGKYTQFWAPNCLRTFHFFFRRWSWILEQRAAVIILEVKS